MLFKVEVLLKTSVVIIQRRGVLEVGVQNVDRVVLKHILLTQMWSSKNIIFLV